MLQSVDFAALLRPFTGESGILLVGSAAGALTIVALFVLWLPTPVYQRVRMWLCLLQWMSNLCVGLVVSCPCFVRWLGRYGIGQPSVVKRRSSLSGIW